MAHRTSSSRTRLISRAHLGGCRRSNMRTGTVFIDVTGPKEEVTVQPVEERGSWESRALWVKVAKGIRESDFETAAREKSRIEVCIPTIHIFFLLVTSGTTHF